MSLESPSVVQIDVYRELEEKYEQTVNEFKSIRTENEEIKQKFYEANKKVLVELWVCLMSIRLLSLPITFPISPSLSSPPLSPLLF